MARKVIQVPIEEELLQALDRTSKRQRKARAALIRESCAHYLRVIENEELDKAYQRGYKRIPEAGDVGAGQLSVSRRVLPRESW